MHKDDYSIDHIDPVSGYRISGLDIDSNKRLSTLGENAKKQHRFLPWRYCQDEIGTVPMELGDLCQFWNPLTEEFELMEFEGPLWWELTTHQLKEEGKGVHSDASKEKVLCKISEQFSLGIHPFQTGLRKAVENSQATQQKMKLEGKHPLQEPEMRRRRAKEDSDKQKRLYSLGLSPLQRPEVVERARANSSSAATERNSRRVECPHCGMEGGLVNMKRYHFDKCKLRIHYD